LYKLYVFQIEMPPLSKSMDEDLAEAAKEVEVRIQIISLNTFKFHEPQCTTAP